MAHSLCRRKTPPQRERCPKLSCKASVLSRELLNLGLADYAVRRLTTSDSANLAAAAAALQITDFNSVLRGRLEIDLLQATMAGARETHALAKEGRAGLFRESVS